MKFMIFMFSSFLPDPHDFKQKKDKKGKSYLYAINTFSRYHVCIEIFPLPLK